MTKYCLQEGFCCKRFVCKNVNTKKCKCCKKGNDDFIECEHFKNKYYKD